MKIYFLLQRMKRYSPLTYKISQVNSSIRHASKDQIGLVKLDLYAMQVFEDDYLGGKLTYLLAADDDNNYYALYYLDSTEVYNEDTFTAYAIPCSTSSFDNISGGTTNVIVLAACYIE